MNTVRWECDEMRYLTQDSKIKLHRQSSSIIPLNWLVVLFAEHSQGLDRSNFYKKFRIIPGAT